MNSTPLRSYFRVFISNSPFSAGFPADKGRLFRSAAALLAAHLGLAGTVLTLSGCQDTKPREYSETAFKPLVPQGMPAPMGGMGSGGAMSGALSSTGMPPINSSPVDIKVTWTLPELWVVKDSANSMRVGSFAAQDPSLANMGELDPNAVDVSVVQLAGDAGGLKANIVRWMGQVGIKATEEEMNGFVKSAARFKTASGQEGMYVDLTDKLSGDMTQSKTIFGAMVQTEDYTVFVKAMGEHAKVAAQKDHVMTFCKSLKIEGPES